MFFNRSIIYKLALPVPIVILICLLAAWFAIPKIIGNNAFDAATRSALQTANQFKIIRGYYTKNVIKKAKANGSLKPSINHVGVPDAIPLPATLIHDLSQILSKQNTTMSLYSAFPFPNRKARKLDEFNQKAWDFLSKNPDQVFKQKELRGGKTIIRVAIADKLVAEGCVSCHNAHPQTPKNDWKLGDVRGVLEINADVSGTLAAATQATNSILFGIFVAGLVLLALLITSSKAISNPIHRITTAMDRIAQGDLSVDVPDVNRQDEVGKIAHSLETFKENIQRNKEMQVEQDNQEQRQKELQAEQNNKEATRLSERQFVADSFGKAMSAIAQKDVSYRIVEDFPSLDSKLKTDFNSAIGQLANTIDKISMASSQIYSGSNEIHTASNELTKRTERQAVSVEKTAAALEQTTSAMKSSTDRAQEVSALVSTTKSNAEQSGKVVLDAVAAMGRIEKSSAEIANIISVIDDIAFQTNLLALNAGVEAARAGESGKGFAVVAQEVRELAQRSAEAAKEIKQLITNSGNEVTVGAELVNETGQSLTTIVSEVSDISEHISAIVSAANEQNIGLQEINQSIINIDQGTQQNAAAAEETTAASQLLSEEVAKINDMLNEFNTDKSKVKSRADVTGVQDNQQLSSASHLTAETPAIEEKFG